MPSYRLSPEAKKDLLNIRAYTKNKWGIQQAQKYIDALEKKCEELAQSPRIGRGSTLPVRTRPYKTVEPHRH